MEYIDLRSDTVTAPTPKMREAMFKAEVGDDGFGDDLLTLELEKLAAQTLSKEAAVFVPSGTFGNQVAIFSHVRPTEEVILSDEGHVVLYEGGATAVLSGVNLRTIKSTLGVMNPDDIEARIRRDPDDHSSPKTGLIIVENPSASGCLIPLENLKKIREIANHHKIPVHMDGARIFSAAAGLNVDVKELAHQADSIMFCLSKNLCCPIGSLVVGSKEFIEKVKRNRKMLGGGLRQTGILAAAGIIGIKEMGPQVIEDHKMAQLLAKELSQFPEIEVKKEFVQTNFVPFMIKSPKVKPLELKNYLFDNKIKIRIPRANGIYRYATHHYIKEQQVYKVIEKMHSFIRLFK